MSWRATASSAAPPCLPTAGSHSSPSSVIVSCSSPASRMASSDARAIRLPDSRARASVGRRMSDALMRTGTPVRRAAPGAAKEMVSGSLMA